MFSKDGNPVRAEVKVTMKEYINQDIFEVGGSRHNITVPQVKLVQMEAGQTLIWDGKCSRYDNVGIGSSKWDFGSVQCSCR